ncbi:MAG: endonuclease [Brumimicrobium sp.]|nr:endonuclease [Brumimicrobium sp.]
MKKSLILLGSLFAFVTSFGQTNINDARVNFSVGQTVTINGVSANAGELGPIRYIQDATGGLPVYGTTINSVGRGDSVTVTGVLKDFNGLLEIDPINSWTALGAGTQIAPWNITITDIGENFEGRLVQIDDITFTNAGQTFAGATNYTFTDGTNTGQLRIQNGSNLVGTTIPSGPQSLVGLSSQFNTNYQILPRDVNDIFAYTPPDKKIVVEVDGQNFLNGNTAFIGVNGSTPITIKNIGVNNLTISGTTITGPQAGDFSTDITAGPIAGGGQTNNTITFVPGGNGSRQAVLTISSDDPDDPNFVINLYAIGNDNLATEPAAGATGLTFNNIKAYTLSAAYVSSATAEKYLVVWKKGSAPTGIPADGQSYLRGDVVGDGQVAYVGAGTSFTPRGIRANTDYHFAVYAFNGYGSYVNYNQAGVLTGNVSSTGEEIGTYYSGINSQNPTLINDLTALINPHAYSSYFLYKTIMMDQFEIKDTVNGESYVECAYSGERKVFSGPFDWTATGYSREHTYSHSWMPTYPADNPEELEYADYHNLYPTNLSQANTPRSNLPLGEITGNVLFTYLEGSVGERNDGSLVYEPRDSQKGNAARSMFYMAVAYNGASGTGDNWQLPPNMSQPNKFQDQDILKNWHFTDLPDNYEIARHELIFDTQNNRNPFIDSVDFACYIDFSQMIYDADGCDLAVETNTLDKNLVVFPNPAREVVYVQVNGMEIQGLTLTDMTGRIVYSSSVKKTKEEIKTDLLNAGTYIIHVNTINGSVQKKLIVQ